MKPSRPRLIVAINTSAAAFRAGQVSAINVALGTGAEEWSTIRYGVYPNEVGLQVFDREAAEAIVSAANTARSKLSTVFRGEPIFVGHPDEPSWAARNPGVRMEAVGRMPELRATETGLQIRHAWNEEGKRLVGGDAPVFDSYSPRWGMVPITYQGRKAFRPVELYSIGLTNRPNIPGTFIGLNEALPANPFASAKNPDTKMKDLIIKLLAALGQTVAADTPDDQLAGLVDKGVTAAKAMKPASEVAAANERATTAETQLTAARGEVKTAVNEAATLRTQLASERAARAGVVVSVAVNEGRITEAQRAEWLAKFTGEKADFSAVEGELKKLKVSVNTKSKVADLGARRGASPGKSTVTAVNEALAAEMKATGCTRLEAMNALRTKKPDLFTNAAD